MAYIKVQIVLISGLLKLIKSSVLSPVPNFDYFASKAIIPSLLDGRSRLSQYALFPLALVDKSGSNTHSKCCKHLRLGHQPTDQKLSTQPCLQFGIFFLL